MATVAFHLKRPNQPDATPIFILFNADGKRTKIYTGTSILPNHWNSEEQRAKTGKGYPKENGYINEGLELMKDRLVEHYSKRRATGFIPSADELKAVIEPAKQTEEQARALPQFFAAYEAWIEVSELTKRPNTIKTYRTTLRHLREFEDHTHYAVTFESMTATFGDKFPAYLITERGLTDSVIRKNILILKNFLSFAAERGLHENMAYKRFSWKHREPDVLTLTKAELQAIAALNLSDKPYLQNARALFLMGCYTGLRFSDVMALRPEHVHGQSIRVTTTKTNDTLLIPLREEARVLVQEMMANKVHPITNQRLNEYVKELGRLAGIDRPTERVQYQGGKRLPSVAVPKYALLTTHTARRTFVTQALKDGMRAEVIRKITGHKDLKSFSRYIEVADRDVEEEFAAVYGKKAGDS
jgi:integrase